MDHAGAIVITLKRFWQMTGLPGLGLILLPGPFVGLVGTAAGMMRTFPQLRPHSHSPSPPYSHLPPPAPAPRA